MGSRCRININCQSFILVNEVNLICESFFSQYNINAFSYSRVFPDGSRSELWTDADALYHTFFNKKYIADTYTPDNYQEDEKFIFLENKLEIYPDIIKKKYSLQLNDQKNIFNHDNCFMILNKTNTLCEYFIFYTPTEFKTAFNFYVNNLYLFENFIAEFKSKSKELISKVDNDRIIKPWKGRVISVNPILSAPILKSEALLPLQKSVLTKREFQVAQHILEGKTAQESAFLLGLSKRTIEYYIENIKNKFGCSRKPELLVELLKMDVFSTFT